MKFVYIYDYSRNNNDFRIDSMKKMAFVSIDYENSVEGGKMANTVKSWTCNTGDDTELVIFDTVAYRLNLWFTSGPMLTLFLMQNPDLKIAIHRDVIHD